MLMSGVLGEVTKVARQEIERGAEEAVLVFDDATGRVIDLGAERETTATAAAPAGRGRPKLGVVAREVTLLPRHWEWLNAQPGGASVALRRLVEEARKASGGRDRQRAAQEGAYRFLTAVAGDFPGYEESLRALFAGNAAEFQRQASAWPEDVRNYAIRLGFSGAEEVRDGSSE